MRQGLPCWLRWERIRLQSGDLGVIPVSGRSPGGGSGNHSSILTWRKISWTEEPGGSYNPWGGRVKPDSATNTFTRKNLLPQPCPNQPPRISVNPPALLQKQHKTNVHSRRKTWGDLLWGSKAAECLKGCLTGAWAASRRGRSVQPAAWSSTHMCHPCPGFLRIMPRPCSQNPPGAFGESAACASSAILILHKTICGKSKVIEPRGGEVQPGS